MSEQTAPPAAPETPAPKKEAKKSNRFETFVTILIAFVSTIIALAASQAAVSSGNAVDAQHNGVLAKINLERVDGQSRVLLAREERVYHKYDSFYSLYLLTFEAAKQASATDRAAHGTRLYQEATAYLEDSNLAYSFLNKDYLTKNEEGDTNGVDAANFINDRQQTAAIYEDVDFTDNFAEADTERRSSLAVGLCVIMLFIAVLFLTWAQITRMWLKWVWLALGVGVAFITLPVYAFMPQLLAWLGV
jgi:hypothetical protein